MTDEILQVPIALVLTCEQLDTRLFQNNWPVERFEVRFGTDVLRDCDPAILRDTWRLEKVRGVPIVFPEQPAGLPDVVDVTAIYHRGDNHPAFTSLLITSAAFCHSMLVAPPLPRPCGFGESTPK